MCRGLRTPGGGTPRFERVPPPGSRSHGEGHGQEVRVERSDVVALAAAHQVELAPYSPGAVLSFMTGLQIAFSSPTACFIDFSPENSLTSIVLRLGL